MSLQYISHWHFWAAVVIVAIVVNWAWQRFFKGKGQLI